MIKQIQVYELRVPPNAGGYVSGVTFETRNSWLVLTCVVDYPPPCPVLDDHRQLPHSWIHLDISTNHSRVLEGQGIVHVHVAGESELRIPNLDDGYLCSRYANNLFHATCNFCQREHSRRYVVH